MLNFILWGNTVVFLWHLTSASHLHWYNIYNFRVLFFFFCQYLHNYYFYTLLLIYIYLSYLWFRAVMKNVAIYLVVLVFWQIHINTSISMGRNKTYQDLLQMFHAVVIKLTYMNNYIYIYM